MIRFATISCFLFLQFALFSQDKILLMNGQELECNITDDSGISVYYEVAKRNGKVKKKEAHKSDIFSLTKKDSSEHVFYARDTFLGDEYTIQEMRIFLAGEQDARAGYNARPTAIVGFFLGAAAPILTQGSLIGSFLAPLAYPVIMIFPTIKIRAENISNMNHQYNDIYAIGYEGVARSKKIISALGGSALGTVVGIIIYYIVSE
jgi:hypothetical protein